MPGHSGPRLEPAVLPARLQHTVPGVTVQGPEAEPFHVPSPGPFSLMLTNNRTIRETDDTAPWP